MVKQLLRQAILDTDAGTCDQLLLHQFISGLPANISKQPGANGKINDLIIEWVKLLLTIEEPQRTSATCSHVRVRILINVTLKYTHAYRYTCTYSILLTLPS